MRGYRRRLRRCHHSSTRAERESRPTIAPVTKAIVIFRNMLIPLGGLLQETVSKAKLFQHDGNSLRRRTPMLSFAPRVVDVPSITGCGNDPTRGWGHRYPSRTTAFAKPAPWLVSRQFLRTSASRGIERRVFVARPRRVETIRHSRGDVDWPVHLIVGFAKIRQVAAEVGLAVVALGRSSHLNRQP